MVKILDQKKKSAHTYYRGIILRFWSHIVMVKVSEWTGFNNVVSPQLIGMYDSGCQIYCNWSTLKSDFYVPEHQSTMPHDTNQSFYTETRPTNPVLARKW